MSSQEYLRRRALKKYVRDARRRKSSLNVDLNAPPPDSETRSLEGTSVPQAAASNAGMAASPINVEAIEDEDVQLLSSLRALPQARNWSRSQPVTVVLDEGPELSIGTSVINVDDHLSRLPLNSFRRRRRLSPNRVIINCEAYENVEDDRNAKMKKAANSRIEQLQGVPKEPMFSCPICMNLLADACSTVCGHVFCQACIKQVFQAQKKCPICRRGLTTKDFHRVFLPTTT